MALKIKCKYIYIHLSKLEFTLSHLTETLWTNKYDIVYLCRFLCFYIAHYDQYSLKLCTNKHFNTKSYRCRVSWKWQSDKRIHWKHLFSCVLKKHVQDGCSHFTPDLYSMMCTLLIFITRTAWNNKPLWTAYKMKMKNLHAVKIEPKISTISHWEDYTD